MLGNGIESTLDNLFEALFFFDSHIRRLHGKMMLVKAVLWVYLFPMANLPNLSRIRIVAPAQQPILLEQFPKYPAAVTERFPEMKRHEADLKEWMRKTNSQLGNVPTP